MQGDFVYRTRWCLLVPVSFGQHLAVASDARVFALSAVSFVFDIPLNVWDTLFCPARRGYLCPVGDTKQRSGGEDAPTRNGGRVAFSQGSSSSGSECGGWRRKATGTATRTLTLRHVNGGAILLSGGVTCVAVLRAGGVIGGFVLFFTHPIGTYELGYHH